MSSLILNIETATEICSVALAKNGSLVSIAESTAPRSHASVLTMLIQKVITESGYQFSELDAIAVSKGPGSYTGLRIGAATAKGLCYALDKPMIAINTLQAMTSFFLLFNKLQISNFPVPHFAGKLQTLFVPLIDARRMEVYTAAFDQHLNMVSDTRAEILNENSFSELLKKYKLIFFGDGVAKCKNVLKISSNADFIEGFTTSANGMINLSKEAFERKQFEDIAYFEPYYLKDFISSKQKSK